jgi:hypothetical protein
MAFGINAELEYGRELPYLNQRDPYLGSILRRIIDAVNFTATNASVSSVGKLSPPPKVDSIQVQGTLSGSTITAPSEILHWILTHNQAVNKGIRYFSEIATDANFTQPHVVDHGTSRTGFLHLPTYLNDGSTRQTYYLRSYAQYHGSDPSETTVLGGLTGAIKIQMTGTSGTTLLSSTGSGTASPQGQQGGKGLGTVLTRPSPQPKRSVGVQG